MTASQGARPGKLGQLAGVLFVLLWVAGDVTQSLRADGSAYPRPDKASSADVQKWFDVNGAAAESNAGLQILAAVALLVFAAVLANLLRSARRAGAASLVGLSGALSAGMLLVGNAALATLGGTDVNSDAPVSQALFQVGFLVGGPLHVAALGLMVVAAATGLGGIMPKWLSIAGIVIGALGLLASLSVIAPFAVAFTLIGRYLAFLWIVIVAIVGAVRRSGPPAGVPAAANAPAANANA